MALEGYGGGVIKTCVQGILSPRVVGCGCRWLCRLDRSFRAGALCWEWTTEVSSGDGCAGRGTEFGEACQQRRLWRQARPRARQTGPHTGKKAGLEK